MSPSDTPQMRRMKFRAWHRGTREADYTVGGFFDRYHAAWNEEEIAWFERFMEEMMDRFLKLDFVRIKN